MTDTESTGHLRNYRGIDNRGTSNRGTENRGPELAAPNDKPDAQKADGKGQAPTTQQQNDGKSEASSTQQQAAVAPSAKADAFAQAARALVAHFKSIPTTYSYQLNPADSSQRQLDFLTNDSFADCAKLVIRAMLDTDGVSYNTGTWKGITVPGFGGERIDEVYGVAGMRPAVDRLVAAGRSTPIRSGSPRVGDIAFWGGHVAVITEVRKTDQDVFVRFATMGASAQEAPPQALEGSLRQDRKWGRGGFVGFWTPYP